jgi:hypothetical protein
MPARRRHGGAPAATAPPRKPWDEYETWKELQDDEGAYAAYLAQRAAVLNNPDLDWGPVLADMTPKLKEDREHIGIASLGPDGRTLRLVASEASPLKAGEMPSETAFAGVPGALVAKYASRPGLFLFHTHPADPRGSPLPSSHDLSTAIYFGATTRFAACAVISRFGVLVHGLDWSAYKAINEAKDWKLAALNLSHDVVAAHEAMRSWSEYTIADYFDFYPRHRLLMFAFPTPEMVGDSRRFTYLSGLETPIDHDLILEHSKDIKEHCLAHGAGQDCTSGRGTKQGRRGLADLVHRDALRPDDAPRRPDDAPRCADDTSRRPDDTSRRADDTSRCADDTSRRADDTSRCADDTSRCADKTSRPRKKTAVFSTERPTIIPLRFD